MKSVAIGVTAFVLGLGVFAGPAGAVPNGTRGVTPAAPAATSACKGALVKPTVHNDALRREATLSSLVSKLQAHDDRFGLNGPQIAVLQSADSAIGALDTQIAGTCYPTLTALRTDSSKLFDEYRVYWLRVPQTNVIVAADSLAGARENLGAAASKLAPLVGTNAKAQADLAAMNAALASADAKLGTPPNAGASIVAAAGLVPAADMSNDTSVLQGAHSDLLAVSASIKQARGDGLAVVADLKA